MATRFGIVTPLKKPLVKIYNGTSSSCYPAGVSIARIREDLQIDESVSILITDFSLAPMGPSAALVGDSVPPGVYLVDRGYVRHWGGMHVVPDF